MGKAAQCLPEIFDSGEDDCMRDILESEVKKRSFRPCGNLTS
jgi:hypothetical protein